MFSCYVDAIRSGAGNRKIASQNIYVYTYYLCDLYCRYCTVPFTKNPEKYIKYNPTQVSALIDRFFDVAA
jgi:organic radical activating enzyme